MFRIFRKTALDREKIEKDALIFYTRHRKVMAPQWTPDLVRRVCLEAGSILDVVNFAQVDKTHHVAIYGSPELWVSFLQRINAWSNTPVAALPADVKLGVVNCLSFKISDAAVAQERLISLWRLLNPIVTELLITDNSNFQSLKIFQKYNNPLSQASILTNVHNFLPLYQNLPEYKTMCIKLDTLINMFINSIINEIAKKIEAKDYQMVYTLINALDRLNINSTSIDPLESLIEFFYQRYGVDYSYLLSPSEVDQFFIENISKRRGTVNGYEFGFKKVDEFFDKIVAMLNKQFEEIEKIFHSDKHKSYDMDEVPIVLKIVEHFLSNYLVGVLLDRLISRCKEIDSMDESTVKLELGDVTGLEHNEEQPNGEPEEEDIRINIMNEKSLFFQSVPYLHFKLISLINKLKYPSTEIEIGENGEISSMDYVKVGCQLVNYCFENYLIEFTNELPLKCKASLFQLIDSWQSKNANIQKGIEHEIMKNVEDDNTSNSNNKFNIEIFSTFSNMFTFKKAKDVENSSPNEIKLSKVAARLKILTNKVESLKSLVSVDLVVLLLQHIKNSYDLLIELTDYSITDQLRLQINQACINIFNDMLVILINRHIKPGFNEALERLKNYDPMLTDGVYIDGDIKTLEPLTNFIELVDVGDLILQMVGIFYDKELINTNIIALKDQHSKDFLRMNSIEKSIKAMESLLDNYVATGLDISIMIIINEIQSKIELIIGPIPSANGGGGASAKHKRKNKKGDSQHHEGKVYGAMYPPPVSSHSVSTMNANTTMNTNTTVATTGPLTATNGVYNMASLEQLPLNRGLPLEWVRVSKDIMRGHFELLQGSIEKGIMDAFKQEIGERFAALFIAMLVRKFVISTTGAVQFSFDVNTLHAFYAEQRIRPAIEYFESFKRLGALFLVEPGRDLARLVVALGRDNGVFTPEEVYAFAARRADWPLSKKHVDKLVYGLGECTIC